MPDVQGNPRRVVGSTDVHFAEDDGSQGRFTGIFDALTPPTFTPLGGDGGPYGMTVVRTPSTRST